MTAILIRCSGVLCVFLMGFVTAFLVNGAQSTDNLTALGTVRGKSYFANGVIHLNWSSSQTYCESKGMELASIVEDAEAEFLKSVYNTVNFNGWFWVASKYTGSGWTWTKTGERVRPHNKLSWQGWSANDPNEHCLVYSSNNHASSYYFQRSCHHVHHVLCESLKPIQFFANIVKNNTKPEEKLIDIGTLEGKKYFGDHVLRNYTKSQEYCQKKGLQLATVTSRARGEFLRVACSKINFDGYFWILGMEGQSKGSGESRCPNFMPFGNSYTLRDCSSKHFTLCENGTENLNEESINIVHELDESHEESWDWDSSEEYEARDFKQGVEEEEAEDEKQILTGTSTNCQTSGSSNFLYIFAIIILICIITGMVIWQTKLWNRIYRPKVYFPVREFSSVRIDRGHFNSENDLVRENPEN